MYKGATREIMLRLLMVQTTFRQSVHKSLKEHGIDISFEMLQILSYLWRRDGINQQELASRTFKDKASLTSLLNNLEARQLIIRMADQTDRRNKIIYLTDSGTAYGERLRPIIDDIYRQAEQKMDPEKTQSCINYLDELNDAFK